MAEKPGPSDISELSAYLDGELPADRLGEVGRLVREDPAWRQAHREMTAVEAALDSYTVPAPPAGLADRVLAGIAASELSPGDFEDLSAHLDGELPPERAAEVAGLVRDDPLWRRTHGELAATDTALDQYVAPAVPSGLADRILLETRRTARRKQVLRVTAWAGSVAAAAAVLLVAFAVWNRPAPLPRPQPVAAQAMEKELETSQAFRDVPVAERARMEEVVVEHFKIDIVRGFFRDYDVVEALETLEAIDRLESEGT